jgi:hypothetical protein
VQAAFDPADQPAAGDLAGGFCWIGLLGLMTEGNFRGVISIFIPCGPDEIATSN